MQANEVKSFLEGKLPGTNVEVEGEGCNFQLNVISDELAALSPVKRQQQTCGHYEIFQQRGLGRAHLSPRASRFLWIN
jgi:acid stress-induced BolA-like protein IbaG/YrbA